MAELQIFSTGVHLQAVEVVINGIKQWRWIAVNFEDDAFMNGEVVGAFEYADDKDDLFRKEEKDFIPQ